MRWKRNSLALSGMQLDAGVPETLTVSVQVESHCEQNWVRSVPSGTYDAKEQIVSTTAKKDGGVVHEMKRTMHTTTSREMSSA